MGAWVNSFPGTPPVSVFTNNQGQGSPLCVDTTTGLLYYLFPSNIVSPLNYQPGTPLVLSNHLLLWGNVGGNTWDGVSDTQAFFGQNQPTFLANGSLGALYGQRIASYTGGAVSDATAPVIGAVRGYTQVAATVGHAVEVGGLFVTDNFSYLAQGVGCTSQGNSWHAGRAWGKVTEAHEYPETYTATASQTIFVVPNGFNSIGYVTKNGTLLTSPANYTAASPNVILTVGALAGDIIKISRSNPQNAIIGEETDIFAGAGPDTTNPISGNRIGHSIFGYRKDKTVNIVTHIGTLLNLIADPGDPTYLIVDRGILPEGQFGTVIDFTASNLAVTNWLMQFTVAGTGIKPNGTLVLPELAAGSVSTPAAGTQALFIDTADHKLKRKDSSGTVTIIA